MPDGVLDFITEAVLDGNSDSVAIGEGVVPGTMLGIPTSRSTVGCGVVST